MYPNDKLRALAYDFLRDPNGELVTLADYYQQSVEASGGQHTKRVLITIVDVQRGETLFVTNAGPGAEAVQSLALADAAVASSAAPVFLQPYKVWVDGGVGSHVNPCYEAMVEATEYFTGLRRGQYAPKHDDLAYLHDNVIHFSFGTTAQPSATRTEAAIQAMLFIDWLQYVLFTALDHANNDQVRLTEERFSRGNNWYSDTWGAQKGGLPPLPGRAGPVAVDAAGGRGWAGHGADPGGRRAPGYAGDGLQLGGGPGADGAGWAGVGRRHRRRISPVRTSPTWRPRRPTRRLRRRSSSRTRRCRNTFRDSSPGRSSCAERRKADPADVGRGTLGRSLE